MSGPEDDLPPFELGWAGTELRRKLVNAVLSGSKSATSSLRAEYTPHIDEPLPRVGDQRLIAGRRRSRGRHRRDHEVRILPVVEVDLAFAREEGEGFETVDEWRRAHERFWHDHEIGDDTLVVAERFMLLRRL